MNAQLSSPPNDSVEELREIVRSILEPTQPPYSLSPEVAALRNLLSGHAEFQIDAHRDIGDGETRLDTGLAVSSTQAAMCADEVARTPVFIRGLHEAIQSHRKSPHNQKTHVLYAGCGPFALLAIPQMALCSSDEVSFTLLDIHEESLNSARSLVDALRFSDHVTRYEVGDATTCRIPAAETPDIIVSETMNVALSKEPQVAIVRHLMSQAPEAIMVPRQVEIRACLMDCSREFNFTEEGKADSGFPKLDRDRVDLGNVFTLNRAMIQQWASETADRLPASCIEMPDPLDSRYQVRLLTEINTFGEHRLGDYDCSLTIPVTFPVEGPIQGGDRFQFHYQLGSLPGLVCERLA